jgi:hypothetical protein
LLGNDRKRPSRLLSLVDRRNHIPLPYLIADMCFAFAFRQGMVVGMFATYFTPTWIFVKVIELAIFAVMFFVIPIVARLPVYDPMA